MSKATCPNLLQGSLLALLVVAVTVSSAQPYRTKREVSYYDSPLDNEEYLLGLLRNRASSFLGSQVGSGVPSEQKRAGGLLDFGLSRGVSGAEAAKARLGLKMAHDPYGPGRR
ncbi:diuretic hormone class 2-like [Ornithodoros turicata]|uniref:diuretic hormone class 2-like n=1 Tax=Ornithodoros turicata TaxID=34597 RepID=UPI003139F3B7